MSRRQMKASDARNDVAEQADWWLQSCQGRNSKLGHGMW